jgi:hypothetical protein
MASAIEIVAAAFAYLGQTPPPSFDDQSAQAVLAKPIYQLTRDAAIASHPWKFALRELFQAPIPGAGNTTQFKYAYPLPPDIATPVGLRSRMEFVVSGQEFYTNDSQAKMYFVKKVPESEYIPAFALALSVDLAGRLAYAITGGEGMTEKLERKAEKEWANARRQDAHSSTPPTLLENIEDLLSQVTYPRP